MINTFVSVVDAILTKVRIPASIWLFERKIQIVQRIEKLTGNATVARMIFAILLAVGFVTVTSLDGSRWIDRSVIDPIEALFTSSYEVEYNDLSSRTVEEVGLLFAPFGIVLHVMLVLLFSLIWIPFWNIVDFVLRIAGKTIDDRRRYWKKAIRFDALMLLIILWSMIGFAADVSSASDALDSILSAWSFVLRVPAVGINIVLVLSLIIGAIQFLRNFDLQKLKKGSFFNKVIEFLLVRNVQYGVIALMLLTEFLPWWTASGSASGYGQSSSVSASVIGLQIFPGWLGLIAALATAYAVRSDASWTKWSSLATTLACMLTLTIGSNSSSASSGGASASSSMGPDFGFVSFLVLSVILLAPLFLGRKTALDR